MLILVHNLRPNVHIRRTFYEDCVFAGLNNFFDHFLLQYTKEEERN